MFLAPGFVHGVLVALRALSVCDSPWRRVAGEMNAYLSLFGMDEERWKSWAHDPFNR